MGISDLKSRDGRRQWTNRPPLGPRHGLARALSKLGHCSRSQAWVLIRAGRVKVNHAVRLDGESRVDLHRDEIEVDGKVVRGARKIYLMLNKPRGLVTTTMDEKGRDTVFRCFDGHDFPFLSAVGRLDKASEGLLLFTNDTPWAAQLTDPKSSVEKVYHVQVNRHCESSLLSSLTKGVKEGAEHLAAKRVSMLRVGVKNCWLEVVLDEGRNRHLRRLLAAFEVQVLRLVRVAIGPLELGSLAKGSFRMLTEQEILALRGDSELVMHNLPNDGGTVDQGQDE